MVIGGCSVSCLIPMDYFCSWANQDWQASAAISHMADSTLAFPSYSVGGIQKRLEFELNWRWFLPMEFPLRLPKMLPLKGGLRYPASVVVLMARTISRTSTRDPISLMQAISRLWFGLLKDCERIAECLLRKLRSWTDAEWMFRTGFYTKRRTSFGFTARMSKDSEPVIKADIASPHAITGKSQNNPPALTQKTGRSACN